MNKKEIEKVINTYCKSKGISKAKYKLYPLYIHLNGFSHSMGFIGHKAQNGVIEHNYNSVSYSGNMSEWEGNIWGYENDYQKELAKMILSKFAHYQYQNNAKEILF